MSTDVPKKFPKSVHYQFCYICKTSISSEEVTFHRIPKKKGILDSEWVRILTENNITAGNSTLICSEHFEKSCFTQKKADDTTGKRRKLVFGSVPTILTPQKKRHGKLYIQNSLFEEKNENHENVQDNDIKAVNYDVETITENLQISNSVNSELSQKIHNVKLSSPVRNIVLTHDHKEKVPGITLDFSISTFNNSPRLTITKNNDIIDILQATFEDDNQERVTKDKEFKALITIKSDSESNCQIFDEVIMEKINDLLFASNSDINPEESELIDDDIQEITEINKSFNSQPKNTNISKNSNSFINGNHEINNSLNHNKKAEIAPDKKASKNKNGPSKSKGTKRRKRKIEEITLDDELSKISQSFSEEKDPLTLEYSNGDSTKKKRKSEKPLLNTETPLETEQKNNKVAEIEDLKKTPMLILKKLNIEHKDPGKLIWGRFGNVWYPALTVNANDVGQWDYAGKVWVLWMGSSRISELDSETEIKPFVENLHNMIDNRPPKKKILGDRIYEAIFKLLQTKFDLGAPKKPYSNWIKFKLQYYMNKSDQFVFHPYPTDIVNILCNLKKKNQKAITNYYTQYIKS